MSVVKLMCEIYHMCMFSNNYIVVMCVNNANVCILDGVSTIVSTSVGYQRADLTNGHTDGKGTCPWPADFFSF